MSYTLLLYGWQVPSGGLVTLDATTSTNGKGRFDAWTSFIVNASADASYDSNGKCKNKPKGDTGVPDGSNPRPDPSPIASALALALDLTLTRRAGRLPAHIVLDTALRRPDGADGAGRGGRQARQ